MTSNSLKAELREVKGTGYAKAVRRAERIPAIVYGGGDVPVSVSLAQKEVLKEMHTPGFFTKIFNLDVAGKSSRAIVKDLQLHPVTDRPLHIDFMRVTKDSRLDIAVPIHFINHDKCPGIKKGGILNIVSHVLHLICNPEHIPEEIVIDLTGLEINHSIHIHDIKLPEDSKVRSGQDLTLATIVAPSGMEVETSETPA